MSEEAKERRADQEWLRLDVEDGTATATNATVELGDIHLSPFGRLYGGAGTALVSVLIEAATSRRLLWVTTQFVGVCQGGDRLDLTADVVADGKRTSQVRVQAYVGDRLVLQALGAAADPGIDIPDHTVPALPEVPPPADCPAMRLPALEKNRTGFFAAAEQRDASRGAPRSHRRWLRIPGRAVTRPALLGLAGDFVPNMVMQEAGEQGAGTSLDNTIRVGAPACSDWVLIDGVPEQSACGYGHGWVRLWSEDGTLVGTASQTAALWRALG
jgi:acyl-CoA thioesterase